MYSFDVFDTLITRATATPKGIFAVMERKLFLNEEYAMVRDRFGSEGFAYYRILAEKECGRIMSTLPNKHYNICDIYNCLAEYAALNCEEKELLKTLELETEKEYIVPIWENINKVKELADKDCEVILISDMYLFSNQIRELLLSIDDCFENIPIYVSCEHNSGKYDGTLYATICKDKEKWNEEWTHVGDNKLSDVDVPQGIGINAIHSIADTYTPLEQEALEIEKSDLALQTIIGAGKLARMKRKDKTDAYEFGIRYGFPILYSYLNFIYEKCEKLGITELYFVARDGYILYKMHEELRKVNKALPVGRYIYGSRKAWKNPENEAVLEEYIRQEINLDATTIGFVEVQGSGETQKCFVQKLSALTNATIYSFYYSKYSLDNAQSCNFIRYSTVNQKVFFSIEFLTRAPHGKCVGYKEENDRIMPVLVDDENVLNNENGYPEYIEGVTDATREYASTYLKRGINAYSEKVANFFIHNFEKHLGEDIFSFICDMYFSDTLNGQEGVWQLAPKLSRSDIERIYPENGGAAPEGEYKGLLPAYSVMRAPKEEQELVAKYLEKQEIKKTASNNDENGYTISDDKVSGRVVIYGAGAVGGSVRNYIEAKNLATVVAVVDKKGPNAGKDVMYPEALKELEYDSVIVAILNKNTYYYVKRYLMFLGVPEEKIIWERYSKKGFETVKESDFDNLVDNSPLRNNILAPFVFKAGERVLLTGKHTGIIGNGLAKRGLEVWTEKSADYDKKEFDAIICFETPGSARLSSLKELLRSDGRLFVICDNANSIYKAYALETSDYPSVNIERMLSNLCKRFKNVATYRLYPDLLFTSMVYNENTEYGNEIVERIMPYAKNPYGGLSKFIYKKAKSQGRIKEAAGSFLFECSDHALTDIFDKAYINADRNNRSQITSLANNEVIKRTLTEDGTAHITRIADNMDRLKKRGIEVIDCRVQNDRLIMPLYKETSAISYFTPDILKNTNAYEEYLDKLWEIILKSSDLAKTGENVLLPMFGEADYGPICRDAFIELVPLNTFYDGKTLLFFDQEFVYDNLPAKFIMYRAISQFYDYSFEYERAYPKAKALKRFGITDALKDIFRQQEIKILHDIWDLEDHYGLFEKFEF